MKAEVTVEAEVERQLVEGLTGAVVEVLGSEVTGDWVHLVMGIEGIPPAGVHHRHHMPEEDLMVLRVMGTLMTIQLVGGVGVVGGVVAGADEAAVVVSMLIMLATMITSAAGR